jgi:dihydrofolate reductase
MRVVVVEFMSLDGVVQAPGGPDEDTEGNFAHGGWSLPFFDPQAMGAAYNEVVESAAALLFGRRTWQVSARAWPQRAGAPFADRVNALPKYVASRTLGPEDMAWNTTLLPGPDALEAIAALRGHDGGNLVAWGSARLVRDVIAKQLVDELVLMVEPIILASGKRLFPEDGHAHKLELVSASTSSTGVQICTYRPATTAAAAQARP